MNHARISGCKCKSCVKGDGWCPDCQKTAMWCPKADRHWMACNDPVVHDRAYAKRRGRWW